MEIDYKKLIIRFLVGLVIFVSAHALVGVIIDRLKGKTLAQSVREYNFPYIAIVLVAGSVYIRQRNQKDE